RAGNSCSFLLYFVLLRPAPRSTLFPYTTLFRSEYEHTIDAKGRLAVPARFRTQMDRGAVISKGMGTCLSVYTFELWERKSNELRSEEHTSELQSLRHLVCRLLLEKKKIQQDSNQ